MIGLVLLASTASAEKCIDNYSVDNCTDLRHTDSSTREEYYVYGMNNGTVCTYKSGNICSESSKNAHASLSLC